MSHRFAVAVVGHDRPGIVALVCGQLAEAGCSLEDVTTTILSGQFAMMLVGTASQPLAIEELRTRFREFDNDGLLSTVWQISEERLGAPEPSHVLSVYGGDRIGIVSTVSRVLADRGINITDMSCRLTEDGTYLVAVEIQFGADEA